jgi:type VI secretion system secreted protein Hcp
MAAVDYFLKIDGIQGESHDAKHQGEIDLVSFSWAEANAGAHTAGGGGAGAGKVAVQDLQVVMRMSKASPQLLLACATGQHFKQAILTARKAGKAPVEFLVFKFTDALVSSYQTGGSTELEPTDHVALSFSRIEVEYRSQKPDGSLDTPVKSGWDVKANTKV